MDNSKNSIITFDRGLFDRNNNVFYCLHNAGFFSNCTVTLWGIVELYRKYKILPRRIDFSKAFSLYKDQRDSKEEVDLYPFLFQTRTLNSVKLNRYVDGLDHHGIYKLIDFSSYSLLIRKYFELSDNTLKVQNTLLKKYDIDLSRTISVIYRGTDKGTEVKLANPELYLDKTRELLSLYPDHKVIIQTDDLSVRNYFANQLGKKCFYFREMPVTPGKTVIHDLGEEILKMRRSQFGELLLAVTNLLSKSHYIVNHTGNMALWVCLFRGNSTNVIQFDRTGKIVTLPIYTYNWLKRLKQRIERRLSLR